MKKEIEVRWTGEYPILCSGEWNIRIRNHLINLGKGHMGTEGVYRRWVIIECSEEWETYTDGLDFEEWVVSTTGKRVLDTIRGVTEISDKEVEEIYWLIQEKDWRSSSCGGCI